MVAWFAAAEPAPKLVVTIIAARANAAVSATNTCEMRLCILVLTSFSGRRPLGSGCGLGPAWASTVPPWLGVCSSQTVDGSAIATSGRPHTVVYSHIPASLSRHHKRARTSSYTAVSMIAGTDESGAFAAGSAAQGSLMAPSPAFSEQEAFRVAHDVFGLTGEARDLGGERDQTFLVVGESGRHILKVSNAFETAANLDLETAAIKHIRSSAPEVPVADVLAPSGAGARDGVEAFRASVEGPRGSHFVRLFEFIEGSAGTSLPPLSRDAVRALGRSIGQLGQALRGFFHPAAGRELLWDLKHAASVRRLTPAIESAEQRAVVEHVLDRFVTTALPVWPQLRGQVVHGDPILENVRLDSAGRVCGIIDFGDIVHSSLLQDVAAALASVLRKRENNTLAAARIFLDGYASCVPLEPIEKELLGVALGARLASIVALGAWEVGENADKAAHFDECVADSWRVLQQLEEVGPEAVGEALGAPNALRPTGELQPRRPELLGEP